MTDNPIVSVILPTYNRADMLWRSISTVLVQTYDDFELVVVDDCSTDNTQSVVKSFQDERIRYIRLDCNSGGSFIPRSIALDSATGKYIAVLDDDSMWVSKYKLELQIKFLEDNPDHVMVGTIAAAVNGSDYQEFVLDYPLSDADIRKKILTKSCFLHPSVVYRSNLAKSAGGYRKFNTKPSKYYSNDYEMWLRLGLLGKVANLPVLGVKVTLEPKNYDLRSKVLFVTHIMQTIRDYRSHYPHYYQAIVFWLFKILLDAPLLRAIKHTLIRRS